MRVRLLGTAEDCDVVLALLLTAADVTVHTRYPSRDDAMMRAYVELSVRPPAAGSRRRATRGAGAPARPVDPDLGGVAAVMGWPRQGGACGG